MKMITKKEVDKACEVAYAATLAADEADDAAEDAWDKYFKLKKEFENGN